MATSVDVLLETGIVEEVKFQAALFVFWQVMFAFETVGEPVTTVAFNPLSPGSW
jgi:hypothetical protein